MFLAHFAVAMAAKKLTPKTNLGLLFIGGQFLDLLWPFFLLLGVERMAVDPGNTVLTPLDFYDYPFSHGLLSVTIMSLAVGVITFVLRRDRREATVLAALVASHWVLDLLVHRPDLPIVGNDSAKLGLGLWNEPVIAILLEALFFATGLYVYYSGSKAKDRTGTYVPAINFVMLALIYIANIMGPPPPNEMAVAISALGLWLFVGLAAWGDNHRLWGLGKL